jgi:hypothetical protein
MEFEAVLLFDEWIDAYEARERNRYDCAENAFPVFVVYRFEH